VTKDRATKSRIINHLVESNLIKPNDKIIVAVSGGMDSMFLLYMLIGLQKMWNLEVVIGHINHNIRPNSINDEKFVIEQGKARILLTMRNLLLNKAKNLIFL
jgi:tRNA(Ile)-lysidine synthase TilS/MesJ